MFNVVKKSGFHSFSFLLRLTFLRLTPALMSLERRSVRCTVVRGRPGTKTGSIAGTWSSSEAASASDASIVGNLRVQTVT